VVEDTTTPGYSGWQVPLVSPQLAAVIEKELRYALRNAQVRMLGLMPLILIVIRFVQTQRVRPSMSSGGMSKQFLTYSSGLLATGGVLYVFLLLSGMSCNLFAFEEGGMRTLILSPIERRTILMGKNVVVTIIAAVFSTFLLSVNAIVFRDFTPQTMLFAILSFIVFASLIAIIGNWFSITFPKRMQFGKRMNVSGLAGLLLIPLLLMMGLPPLAATLAGYYWQSFLIEFAVLGVCAALTVLAYFLIVGFQGRSLARREIQILEVVKEREGELA
jgi:ABC-type multidrug transport system permease subunit